MRKAIPVVSIAFVAGIAVGASVVGLFFRTSAGLDTDNPKSDAVSIGSAGDNGQPITQSSEHDSPIKLSIELAPQSMESSFQVAPGPLPNTPQEYVRMLGPSYLSVSMEDLHLTFSLQKRQEAWAFAVESEISQYVASNSVAEWAEIEFVECRSSICEIAGYLRGPTEHDPREILEGLSDSTWWHQNRSVHKLGNSSDGIDRFVIILTASDFGGRVRPPRLVE